MTLSELCEDRKSGKHRDRRRGSLARWRRTCRDPQGQGRGATRPDAGSQNRRPACDKRTHVPRGRAHTRGSTGVPSLCDASLTSRTPTQVMKIACPGGHAICTDAVRVRAQRRGAGLELCRSRFPCRRNETCQRERDRSTCDSHGNLQETAEHGNRDKG